MFKHSLHCNTGRQQMIGLFNMFPKDRESLTAKYFSESNIDKWGFGGRKEGSLLHSVLLQKTPSKYLKIELN